MHDWTYGPSAGFDASTRSLRMAKNQARLNRESALTPVRLGHLIASRDVTPDRTVKPIRSWKISTVISADQTLARNGGTTREAGILTGPPTDGAGSGEIRTS